MDQNPEGNDSNERAENAEFADRDSNDSNSTEATSRVAPVCVVSTYVWHPSSGFPNLGPAYSTGWLNMAAPFAINPYFSTNPYGYGYVFMLPPIMPSNYAYPSAYDAGGSTSNQHNYDQSWFNWGGQQGGITGEGVVIGENLASNIQNPERLSTSSDSPKACDDFNMEGPGITLRKWVESKCSNAGKKEKMRLFRNIVIVVDVEHSRRKALIELCPSSFIIFETGRVKYVGSMATAEATGNSRKRDFQPEFSLQDDIREKMQKLDADKLEMPRPSSENKTNTGVGEGTSAGNTLLNAWLEKKWYAFPECFDVTDLLSLNVYSLGFLLFEVLCHFDTIEEHSVAMLDLHEQILPPSFLCKSPKEAQICLWLHNPDPSLCPTTREILESELIYGIDGTDESNEGRVSDDMDNEMGLDVFHDFLVSSEQHMQSEAANLSESIKTLEGDINAIENRQACSQSSNNTGASTSEVSNGCADKIRDKLYLNLGELENIYFSMKSNPLYAESTSTSRPDIVVLTQRNELSLAQDLQNLAEEKSVDPLGIFFDGICKFAQYNKFEVCGMLRNKGVPDSNNIISSLGFDHDE